MVRSSQSRLGRRRAAGLCCVVIGCGLAGLVAACSSPPPTATAHTVSLETGGRTQATLEVLTGTTVLDIGMADLGTAGSLLRVVTPPGAPAARLETDDGAGGSVVDLTASNAPTVTVTLNTRVRWRLELGGGTSRTSADLRRGQVTGIAFTAGSSVISLALPRPHGIVPIQLTGGASDFSLSLPSGVPAQVTASGGAGEVLLEGADHVGVAGGSVFTTAGWTQGEDGFDIDATSGASRIAVTARAGS